MAVFTDDPNGFPLNSVEAMDSYWQFLGNFFGNMKDASEFSLKIPEMNCLQRFVTLNLQICVTEIWNHSFLELHAFEVVINFRPHICPNMSSVQNPGWLFYIQDYTTHLYGDCNFFQDKDPEVHLNQSGFHGSCQPRVLLLLNMKEAMKESRLL